jgi:hypothetical protein
MPGYKRVMHTLGRFWKPRQSAVLPQGLKFRFSAGQKFMHIALMTDIKYKPVYRRIKNPV